MQSKIKKFISLLLALSLLFTSCNSKTIEEKGDKVLPAGPLSQMVLYTLAPEKIAALADRLPNSCLGFVDEKFYDLPYIGQLYPPKDMNMEKIALTNASLIIDIGEDKDSLETELQKIEEKTGIKTIHVTSSLESMPETYRELGEILDKKEEAEQLASFCERVYTRTIDIIEKVGDNKIKGIYVLGANGQNILAKDSYHSETIDLLIDNIAVVNIPSSKGTGNEVDIEQIASWDPSFIIFAPDCNYQDVIKKSQWQTLNAIKNNQYVEVPESPRNWLSNPPSVQRYLGLIWLTKKLYPTYCDYDEKAEIKEFFSLFYHHDLTDEEYNNMMKNAVLK